MELRKLQDTFVNLALLFGIRRIEQAHYLNQARLQSLLVDAFGLRSHVLGTELSSGERARYSPVSPASLS